MLFNSLHFILFFPLVVGLYFLIPQKYRWILLLIASYYFYMCWKVEYIVLIIFSTIIDYGVAIKMVSFKEKKDRKKWLYLSLLTNLGLLFSFKYFNFFNESVRLAFNQFNLLYEISSFEALLPVGISFYTFQTLSYTIDVYNDRTKPERHLGRFAVFVSFFPQLVAGPIERSNHLLPQFVKKQHFSYDRVKSGLQQMLWGFYKKVVVADRLAIVVDGVYNNLDSYAGIPLIIATLFFAFQIYCDFSGYSDIAIGSARVMGFELMENFKFPYYSKSISEFWKRWHISLSTWFRDYVYIPMGGNRVVKWKWYYNLAITFLVSGFWHGANWTFIVWGALHGAYLILATVTQNTQLRVLSKLPLFLNKIVHLGVTFSLVCFAWIFFRSNNLSDSIYIIVNLLPKIDDFSVSSISTQFRGLGVSPAFMIVTLLCVLGLELFQYIDYRMGMWHYLNSKSRFFRWGVYYLILAAILFLAPYTELQNFIYFQF